MSLNLRVIPASFLKNSGGCCRVGDHKRISIKKYYKVLNRSKRHMSRWNIHLYLCAFPFCGAPMSYFVFIHICQPFARHQCGIPHYKFGNHYLNLMIIGWTSLTLWMLAHSKDNACLFSHNHIIKLFCLKRQTSSFLLRQWNTIYNWKFWNFAAFQLGDVF